MGARVYDPSLMRFLTPDYPDCLDPMARYGLNPYCYCHNDPLSYSDPTGHSAIAFALFIGIVFGACVNMGANVAKQRAAGRDWNDLDWLSIAGSGVLGAALGIATVLGGAAGLVYAGASISGYALSASASFAISTAAVTAGNMLNYSFQSHGNITPEGLAEAAIKGALKGAATFAVSFAAGANGLFLEKAHSSMYVQDFYFLNPGRAWVLGTLPYRVLGEFGARSLFASLPAALIRWMIDQW